MTLTQKIVRELLYYDYLNGKLYWLERSRKWFKSDHAMNAWNARYAGKEALASTLNGYNQITLFGKKEYAHRIVFLYNHGYMPKMVDHINGNRDDNRVENLREADDKINTRNSKKRSDNTSGETGVNFCKQTGKWMARCESIHLGRYDTVEEAAQAVAAKRRELGGYSPRHGE